jgi:putative transposase
MTLQRCSLKAELQPGRPMKIVSAPPTMYRWRRMSLQQQCEALEERRRNRLPWHSPPHYVGDSGLYLITAACFEHQSIIGRDALRMADFEVQLIAAAKAQCQVVFAWVVLPNHYHMLVHAPDIKGLLKELGRLHGRTSYRWNGEDGRRGRRVWFNVTETEMKSERHFWATMNYVLHNAVRHGYVERWQDWPYSNAAQYLAEVGRQEAQRRWQKYPILDYGKDWDPPEL